jgi:hypothetical protein
MSSIESERLLQAARTSVALITLVHETLWSLFPDELLALTEAPEHQLLDLLRSATNRPTGPPGCSTPDP